MSCLALLPQPKSLTPINTSLSYHQYSTQFHSLTHIQTTRLASIPFSSSLSTLAMASECKEANCGHRHYNKLYHLCDSKFKTKASLWAYFLNHIANDVMKPMFECTNDKTQVSLPIPNQGSL